MRTKAIELAFVVLFASAAFGQAPGEQSVVAIPGIAITTVEKYAGQFYRILQK